ncbi:helix-turn-helix transcriptional regulator, partial [Amycolatopsis sp. NPDC059090]|uniref:helix-turn-helix transcriptional regulator n=1 Tax=Amycolatopsis sp. NPDC059090 TaxID=3346723 RepID=UPI0036703978
MKQRPGDEISINDLARAASLSKFHFCRLFRRVTGITPGRFLSAIRLEEAKRLLLATDASVTEISFAVGYNSLGTFTSRFTRSVGLTPTAFRRQASSGGSVPGAPDHEAAGGRGSIGGTIASEEEFTGLIIVALFEGPIPEGRPRHCTRLPAPGPWRIDNIPPGDWHVVACGLPNAGAGPAGPDSRRMLVATHTPRGTLGGGRAAPR